MLLWKCYTQYASKFGKLSSGHRTGKSQFSFQSQRRAMPKNVQTTAQFVFISHDSKVMLKILQARLQKYVNQELLDVQTAFRKRKRTRDKIANIYWIIEKLENSRKTSTSASLTMLKPLTVWIITNCEKFWNRWEYHTTLPASWETCMHYKLKARLRKNRCIVHQILIYVLQRAMSRERKCNPQDGRKYHTSNKKLISRIC